MAAVDEPAEQVIEAETSVVEPDIQNEVDVEQHEGECGPNTFSNHLRRQALLCQLALSKKYKYLPESISEIAEAFEDYIFNPDCKSDRMQQEARFNFYPPFALPERIATYSSFFQIVSVPLSCAANRTGTKKYVHLKNKSKFDFLPKFDSDLFVIADTLGSEVTATDSLPRKSRLVNLKADYSRLVIVKEKLGHVTQFAYPALNLPPKLFKLLVTVLYKPIQQGDENEADIEYVYTDEVLTSILNQMFIDLKDNELTTMINDFRKNLLRALQYVLPLKLMQMLFRHAGFVKKMQEILHYTFHHGFIKLVSHITGQNLSKYITFHSMTYENNNNNAHLHSTLDLNDGEDYMIDTIFLFLTITWQTAMGIWQQNLNEQNLNQLLKLLKAKGPVLVLCRDADSMADMLAEWVSDDGMLMQIFQQALPDFTSQAQINNFRTFIMSRSNIVSCMVPAVVKDFVPIDFKECPPILWPQVYLLQITYFLYNHGDYQQIFFCTDPETKCAENEVFCNCNLCSPHRTPMFNSALHNEILAIGTFDFYVPSKDANSSGERITLSAGMWANKFLDHFVPKDFHPFEVIKYLDYPERFKEQPTACIITKPEILSTLRDIKKKREKFLLEKGSGIYLDPETGDNLSDTKIVPQPATKSPERRRSSP
ncbi:100K protein [Chinstrap penguin adenovirus 2]|uniref:100K protein n=2 Tax=Chinstrap penguin adenovirus 2 TaxID=1434088 RepID=A0A161CB87_9ADEN|nr:100K protein [Chinstrap penguin adenovirus 2]ALB78149.1 100K protein [Chinstrap penguin adenovirus 2]